MTRIDVSAEKLDLTLNEGDDETITLVRNKEDGTAYDVTNWTFWLTLKNRRTDPDANAAVQKTVTTGGHTDPTNGTTEFDLSNTDTDDLTGRYIYDIQEKDAGGAITTLCWGTFEFEHDVTETTS